MLRSLLDSEAGAEGAPSPERGCRVSNSVPAVSAIGAAPSSAFPRLRRLAHSAKRLPLPECRPGPTDRRDLREALSATQLHAYGGT